ncbi:major facilitator superfamily domain-containing protein [Dactylonectria estremocensis]|uniref:Major facilitator superfamily domain-containing protein n=1 Tax=Dactylonectria estremocensis TaxID=1079267 RepID=A0A9P9ICQ3_9HYPO|nr:major facilitator superfamily domain-containing protein [Dactylonectria estremocensis]
MSLAQHVTQVEGFDYEGPANPNSNGNLNGNDSTANEQCLGVGEDANRSEWRRMSFAPVEITQDETHIAAYRVSNSKRYGQAATAVIACWLASGIVFGFAALKPVLIAEGVYHELCRSDETTGFDDEPSLEVPCAEQDMRLNLFFISASITTNISSLFAGTALDRFGRRACWRASCVFLVVGSLLMGSSFAIPEFDGYLLGNVLLALGGTFLFVPSFELANMFPKHSGLVVALITGAFDASAAVFLFYRMAYDASGGKFSLEKFFFGYLIVPVLIFLAEIFLMPSHAYHTMPELKRKIEKAQDRSRDVHDSDEDISDAGELTRVRSARANKRKAKLETLEELAGGNEHRDERIKIEEERQEASGVWGMLSPWFILILLLTVFQMLRMNYFIASIRAQYRYMLESEIAAAEINEFFDVALPLGGVASTLFIGLLLNNLRYATVVAFVLFRPLYYSAISDYAVKVFGFATFGRIYGTIVCLSGIVNFVQSGLDALTHGPLHGNPTPINATLGALGVFIGVTLTIFVRIRGRVFMDEKAELDVGPERRRLLSVAHDGYGARN